ncbi:MAG: cytochrome c biogenesis protein, partial [Planctomycetes bacterium]|nr:cytochrome c biogenesis protein [Planctomycetota bacterium]
PGRGVRARRLNGGVWIIIPFLLVGGAQAGDAKRLDWSAWRHLPAFGEGRVEPLDSFARKSVEAICGRTDPTLVMEDGGQRKYAAAELLFAWLAETEKWEYAPFLPAEDEWLRRDVLELPLLGGDGRRLSFVSPAQVENNPGLGRYWAKLQQRAESEGKEFRLSERDRKVERLVDAYGRYRRLTFDAEQPKDTPRRFYARARSAGAAWRMLVADRQGARRIAADQRVRELMVESGQSLQKLIARLHEDDFSRKKIEPAAAAFREASEKLAERLAGDADKPLAALAAELRRQAIEMHLALYDNGDILRLVPALNPGALEENRTPEDDASPWLGFQAMIDGSDDLLRGYPRPELDEARKAFAEARSAYRDRDAAARPAKFAAALRRFSRSLRALAEKNEPLRRRLPLLHRDESLLDATAYPPPGSTAAEVFYNRLDPFFWSWVVGLAATLCLLSAVGRLRRPAFWAGTAALAVSLGFTLAGLGLRTYITGLVPLTGMFESVVVVATFVYALGLWLALLPLLRFNEGWAIHCPLNSETNHNQHSSTRVELVLQRRLFALAGAIVGTLALALAYYAPATVMYRNIGAAAPILRDNFWLVMHVVTIMAGYASAAIALILGNAALGYYLFGRYCDSSGDGRRSPPACSVLAGFIYTAIKITVLLLAAGTILGALWADKSWGRFWGWDLKEVWALISLLVYLFFLHARHIGWSGNFGMSATAVLGATVILFNWYGVNFVLGSGLHAYGAGAGGQLQVGAAVLIQWLFLFAASVRYLIETRGGLLSPSAGVQ